MSDDPLKLSATPKPRKKGGFLGLFGGSPKDEKPSKGKGAPMSNGILGGLTGLSATWTTEEAFCAIIYATALVDGDVHAKEWEEIRAIGHRVKIFEKKSDADVDAILDKVKTKITWDRKGEFPWSQVEGACAALAKKNQGLTVFANACDIVFADRTIEQTEVDLLNRISGKLALDSALANQIIEVIKIKNGHNE
jgi:tellurite resistance protein